MNNVKYKALSIVIVAVGTVLLPILYVAVLLLCTLTSCSSTHSIYGLWKDTEEDYYVEFREDETYRDSVYNLNLLCKVQEDGVLYNTPAGDTFYADIKWSWDGHPTIYVGGKYRILEQQDSTSKFYHWDNSDSELKSTGERYTLKSALDWDCELLIGDDSDFVLSWDSGGNILRGKAASAYDSSVLVLYYNSGESVEVLPVSNGTLYLGMLPLLPDGELVAQKSYQNLALGEVNGYTLSGIVCYPDSNISFTFTEDSRCVKTIQGVATLEYSYYVDTDGLITLGAVGGSVKDDYLYYDSEANQVYRVVLQRDSWFDFVTDIAAPVVRHTVETDTLEPLTNVYINRAENLAVEFIPNACPVYRDLSSLDASYTAIKAEELRVLWEQVAQDDAARREYELSLLSEREQLFLRAKAEAEAQAKLKAAMDARVQVDIESGKKPTPTQAVNGIETIPSLSPSGNIGGYDQDASSSRPVVNTGGGDEVSSPSATPTPAAPTEPGTSSGGSETVTPEYNPVFHVDFVCTCVNCYKQSLPVELNADNILLVDASIIVPGTLVNLEGFGMVTAREAGGTTSGQTAVCYSKSHNAVIRFSSGTYNVYQVVG